jgi:HSP20 family protein
VDGPAPIHECGVFVVKPLACYCPIFAGNIFFINKTCFMETKAVDRQRTSWPTLFDRGWMDKFFNSPLDEFLNPGKVINVPAVNVSETEKEFKLCIAAPGLDKKDFKIDAYDDMLTISAEHEREEKEEKNGRFNRREYNYASWSRSFSLPDNCDTGKIEAEYKNGELKLRIPKMEVHEPKNAKSITVN